MNKKSQKQQITKRQHWLPRSSYLGKFVNENGKVTVYRFQNNQRADFIATSEKKEIKPENVGLKKNLYETPALPPNTIENVLANIESKYGRILNNKILKNKKLTKSEHDAVAQYISTLENRTPMQEDHVKDFIRELDEAGRSISFANDAPQAAEDWSNRMKEAENVIFAQWMAITIDMNKWYALDFCFLKPASYVDARFITSDHPVTLVDYANDNSPYGLNQWNKTAECIVVLTPDLALLGNRCGITGYKEVDYNMLREINNRVLRRADKMIISRGEIDVKEADHFINRMPQSLLLQYLNLPKTGRADKIIRKQKRREKYQAIKTRILSRINKGK